ncbi:MAG: hypothetical protein DMG16_22935 [Acidobacteria bacterium]|nr:MAG: hypothetical protein DMG16_22935 [Acidobacteriota bacterium]
MTVLQADPSIDNRQLNNEQIRRKIVIVQCSIVICHFGGGGKEPLPGLLRGSERENRAKRLL